jgi:hypothetical protein
LLSAARAVSPVRCILNIEINKRIHLQYVNRFQSRKSTGQRLDSSDERSVGKGSRSRSVPSGVFPMTHHVECVALLEKTGSDLR